MTINDVRSKRRQSMAVVLLSWSSVHRKPFNFGNDYVWNMIKGLTAEMAALDIVVVCAAGNAKSRTPNADTTPAILSDFHSPMLVVSSCDNEGKEAPFSQIGDFGSIYAPGIGMTCARAGAPAAAAVSIRSGSSYCMKLCQAQNTLGRELTCRCSCCSCCRNCCQSSRVGRFTTTATPDACRKSTIYRGYLGLGKAGKYPSYLESCTR